MAQSLYISDSPRAVVSRTASPRTPISAYFHFAEPNSRKKKSLTHTSTHRLQAKISPCRKHNNTNIPNTTEATLRKSSKPSNHAGATGKLSRRFRPTELSTVPRLVLARPNYLIRYGLACAITGTHLPWSKVASQSVFNMEPESNCPNSGWNDRKSSPLAAASLNYAFIHSSCLTIIIVLRHCHRTRHSCQCF